MLLPGVVAAAWLLPLSDASEAYDYRYIDPQLLPIHEFASIVIPKDNAPSVRAFVKTASFRLVATD
jgi:hypothetical protein